MLGYRMETGLSAQQVHTYHRCYPTFTPTLYTLGAIYRGHLINVQTQAYWGCGGNWGNPQGECAYIRGQDQRQVFGTVSKFSSATV